MEWIDPTAFSSPIWTSGVSFGWSVALAILTLGLLGTSAVGVLLAAIRAQQIAPAVLPLRHPLPSPRVLRSAGSPANSERTAGRARVVKLAS